MERKVMKQFVGKLCLLRFKTNFVLVGMVTEIFDDGFFFQTKEKTSFISYDAVNVISEK